MTHDYFMTGAGNVPLPVLGYVEKGFGNVDGFVAFLRAFMERTLDGSETVSLFMKSRRLPSESNVLMRFQFCLENESFIIW